MKYDFVIVINNFFTKKTVKLRKTREEYLKIFRYKKKIPEVKIFRTKLSRIIISKQ